MLLELFLDHVAFEALKKATRESDVLGQGLGTVDINGIEFRKMIIPSENLLGVYKKYGGVFKTPRYAARRVPKLGGSDDFTTGNAQPDVENLLLATIHCCRSLARAIC